MASKITEKKKEMAIKQGAEIAGYIVKRNGNYQIIADGRTINITENEFRETLKYPK